MYSALKTVHSYWAYLALAILIIASINALIGMSAKKDFGQRDLRISLFGLIFSHIQLFSNRRRDYTWSQLKTRQLGSHSLRHTVTHSRLTQSHIHAQVSNTVTQSHIHAQVSTQYWPV